MQSEVKTYTHENGEIQRVQVVRFDNWSELDFLWMEQENKEQQIQALKCFRDIYANYLVPACPWIFPQMVMFSLPEEINIEDFSGQVPGVQSTGGFSSKKYGVVNDRLIIASIILEKGIRIRGGKPVFLDTAAKHLWQELEKLGCIHIVCGKFPSTKIIPVGKGAGYLSKCEGNARLKVNANFFIMDPFDCATIYDQVGTAFGLCVKDGQVQTPPLFGREALLVRKDGSVSIREIDVRDLEIEINGVRYIHGKNATIYSRPERSKTPAIDGTCLVVVGKRVVAIKEGGPVPIPASGFVMRVDGAPGDAVIYHGLEDVQFGIQVGNSIVRDGEKTIDFISKFYNIYHLEPVPFPPSLYPMNYEKGRAARIAIGADKNGKPVILWAEGAGKLRYTMGEDSTGASLLEMSEIAEDLELSNVINLDGGGSAQMLIDGARALRISDRNKADNSDAERLVPLGLVVR